MAVLVAIDEFRIWSGVGDQTPDAVIGATIDEAEAAIAADVGESLAGIMADPAAHAIAKGEALRRTNRLLARKNSPEAVLGAGIEGVVTVPSRDPDSQRAVWGIQSILGTSEGVS